MKDGKDIALKAINYMEKHLADDIRLEDIAKAVGYSKFHLNRLFAEATGETMYQYLQKRRLTEAAKKLVYTEKSIADIAYEAQYNSQQSFTLAFRQVYCHTPQVYRKMGIFRSEQDKITMCVCFSYTSAAKRLGAVSVYQGAMAA